MAIAKSGRCVHCLVSVDKLTRDHLFPRSWYPDTTPPDLEKWKLPSCSPCNHAYGKIEERLKLQLAACVDPKSEGAAGIWKRAYDSIRPEKGRNSFDSLKRKLAQRRFVSELRPADNAPMNSALPTLNPVDTKGNFALLVKANDVHRFIEKLVRGTIYISDGRYIEANQEITTSVISREGEAPILELIETFGEPLDRGPGIRILKAAAHEKNTNALFVFDIWGQFRFFGSVTDREP